MKPTLAAAPGAIMRIPAVLETEGGTIGFENNHIIVNFRGPRDPDILASNVVSQTADGFVGVIHINLDLQRVDAVTRKAVLAHEWIEVMVAFRDGERDRQRVSGKIDLCLLNENLRRPTIWQDSPDEASEMQVALRRLLVDEESLRELAAADFQLTFAEIRSQCAADPQVAAEAIKQIATAFSSHRNVDKDLVFDRLQEILFDESDSPAA